ncbi:DNA-directed DNA polymerase alpha catalytic subunit pol1 [Entomophthora muscae]|uniref:DNA-directed DNA polymerase alpha catalytic subunit pol1 n=1 Tax=Entomophthora muscae TaxID=34485 RepID=A0ACC2S455_9FUNG|nr:DNA-directed DNA polymerase alpha catalytic subunit pol1 [Entomophthora muscae]
MTISLVSVNRFAVVPSPPERFIIYKSISKDLVKYADAASQPHVQVALRLQKQQGFVVGKGSTIDYIICLTDDPSKPYAQRAFSADEVSKDSSLQVDYDWYISRQLLPPITRLCEPIDGITMSQLAESLGLDGSKFTAYQNSAHSETIFDNLVSQEQRFRDIAKLPITCVRCPGTVVIEHFAAVVDDKPQLALVCPDCQTPLTPQYLLNKIQLDIRAHIHHFNMNWTECNEPICRRRTRSIASNSTTRACLRPGCEGTMQLTFSPRQLYDHIAFYMHLFDERAILTSLTKKGISPATAQTFMNSHQSVRKPIASMIESHLKLNARRFVNLGRLFKANRKSFHSTFNPAGVKENLNKHLISESRALYVSSAAGSNLARNTRTLPVCHECHFTSDNKQKLETGVEPWSPGNVAHQPTFFGLKSVGCSISSPQSLKDFPRLNGNPTGDAPLRAQVYAEAVAFPKGISANPKITPPNECQPVPACSIQASLYLAGLPGFRNTVGKQKVSCTCSPTSTNQEPAKPANQLMSQIPNDKTPVGLKPTIPGEIKHVFYHLQSIPVGLQGSDSPSAIPAAPQPVLFRPAEAPFGPVHFTKHPLNPAYLEFNLENILIANPLTRTRKPETFNQEGCWYTVPQTVLQ